MTSVLPIRCTHLRFNLRNKLHEDKGEVQRVSAGSRTGGRSYVFLVSCGDSTPRLPQSGSEVGGWSCLLPAGPTLSPVSKNCFWKLSLKFIPSAFPPIWQALSYCLIISSCLNSSKWILFPVIRQYLRRGDALRLREVGSCAWGCLSQNGPSPICRLGLAGASGATQRGHPGPRSGPLCLSLCLSTLGYSLTLYCARGVIQKSRAGVWGVAHGVNSWTSVPGRQPPRVSCWSTQCGFHGIVSNWATKVMLTGWSCDFHSLWAQEDCGPLCPAVSQWYWA